MSQMRVVSGIQPTGGLHLGNLLGAILRWVRMQDEAQCLYFLADLHSLSEYMDPAERRASVREMAAALIASGIDPDKSVISGQVFSPNFKKMSQFSGVGMQKLDLSAMSRVSSICCFWSSPTGTCVAW